jgi:hypothetical protein
MERRGKGTFENFKAQTTARIRHQLDICMYNSLLRDYPRSGLHRHAAVAYIICEHVPDAHQGVAIMIM